MKKMSLLIALMATVFLTVCGIQGKAGEVSADGVTHYGKRKGWGG